MYLLELFFENAALNGCGKLIIPNRGVSIRKWTVLGPEKANLELLRLIALATADPGLLPHSKFTLTELFQTQKNSLQLEFHLFQHAEAKVSKAYTNTSTAGGIAVSSDKNITRLSSRECRYLVKAPRFRKVSHSNCLAKHFLTAYGPFSTSPVAGDDFEFNDPFYRLRRFHSLFDAKPSLTDPVAFLELLQYRGLKHKRISALRVITEINQFFESCLETAPSLFGSSDALFDTIWRNLTPWRRRMALPIIDVCRHLYDAFPKSKDPFLMPGVMLLHRPDLFCTPKRLNSWIHYLDSVLPRFQFIITLPDRYIEKFPDWILKKRLPISQAKNECREKKKKPPRLPAKPILLIQMDGRLPNLALGELH